MEKVARPLALGDATQLAHAYVHAVADGIGVRALSIKGPAADHHGVRPPRVAADADVLVDPVGFHALVERLCAAGWHERQFFAGTEGFGRHSVTLIHEGWPCDLDVHHQFPGFLQPAGVVFEELWDAREARPVAAREVLTPDRDATILISALHSLRGSARIARHALELEELVKRFSNVFTDDDRARLGQLARVTGCVETLDGALHALGVPRSQQTNNPDPELQAWRAMVASGATATYFWLRGLRRVPLRRLPVAVARIGWPDERHLRQLQPTLRPGRRAANGERLLRIVRGLHDLPRVIVALVATGRRR